MFGSNRVVGPSQSKKKNSPREKQKAIIQEYEKRYGVSLTEEELDGLLDEAFNSSSFSDETKKEVRDGLKERKKKGKEKSKKPPKKEK